MMKVTIFYASIEGQTRKIAQTLATTIEARGHSAAIVNVAGGIEFGLERADAAILCAPIHAGRYPTPFIDFVHREKAWLDTIPIAIVSVTLSIRSEHEDERRNALSFPDALTAETGIRPVLVHHAAGALRFTEYDFFKRWIMRAIAEKDGQAVDPKQDVEYTDWTALEAFADNFLVKAVRMAKSA